MKSFIHHIITETKWSGSKYIIEKNPSDKLWYVMGHVGKNKWMPISTGFKDKKKAEKWRDLQPGANKDARKETGGI
jgi:hypothetical protein